MKGRNVQMKKGSSTIRVFWTVLLQGLLCGVAVGCMTGLLEVAALLPTTRGTATNFFMPVMMFYGTVWAVIAVVFGVALFVICRAFNVSLTGGEHLTRWYLAVLIPLALFFVVGGHINMRFLPAFTDWRSLLFDVGFLLANLGLGVWLYRHGLVWMRRFITQRSGKFWRAIIAGALAIGFLTGSLSIWGRDRAAQTSQSTTFRSGPNVLLIAIDALRPDHLSCYGYHRRTSPNLDQLAQEGVLFTNAFTNSSWTKASVATILTSLYPASHSANLMASGVSPSLLTLPEVLKSSGYATGIFSANAFLSPVFGHSQGVDRFYYKGVSVFSELILGHITRALRRYSSIINRIYTTLRDLEWPPRVGRRKATDAPGLNEAFMDWVKTLNGRPFFAYIHYIEPHAPYAAPPPFNAQFDPSYTPPYVSEQPVSEGFEPFHQSQSLPPRQLENLLAQYDGEIAYVDHALGKFFQLLRELGLYEQTLILVTADHGEEFYEHRGWGHGKSLFNEALRVPLILRYPPVFPRGEVVTQTVRHVDLMPTILDLCDISVSSFMEGQSLVSLIHDPEAISPPVYSEVFHAGSYARAVQNGRYKLIEAHSHSKEAWLLFDLEQDPGEQHPLEVETHPKGQELRQLLASFHGRANRIAVAPKTVHIDQDTQDRLRALGYLQ